MNQSIPYLHNNASFNPLYAKMRERFCADGTIAEKMAVEAGLYKKRPQRTSTSEYHMTHANSLPKRRHGTKKVSRLKSLFSLKHLGVLSVSLLVAGTVFFTGATFDGIRQGFSLTAKGKSTAPMTEADSILSELPTAFENSLGFSFECEDAYL